MTVNGETPQEGVVEGWWRVERPWTAGDEVLLTLPMEPRLTAADPRLDVDRGCVALERGPLVYCLEGVDHDGQRLDDLVLATDQPLASAADDGELGPVVLVQASGAVRGRPAAAWWPYAGPEAVAAPVQEPAPLTAVPYFAWGNRAEGAMRIWVPTA